MRTFALGVLIVAGLVFSAGNGADAMVAAERFMAFCNDGDGALTEWVDSRNEAYIAGRDHERAARGHRWEVLVQPGKNAVRPASCALVADGTRPETVRLENICGECRTFVVSRRNADGTVKTKEFTVKAKSNKHFRKITGAEITVDGERDCAN